MKFQNPYLLILMIPVVIAAIISNRRLIEPSARNRFIVVAISACLLIVALANPYWSFAPQPQIVKGIDLILVVDVSQSMFCADGAPRRIDQARNFIRGMLPRFAGSSAGLIYFAKDAEIGVPMTPDLRAIQIFLDSVTPRMTDTQGTESREISDAIEELLGTQSVQLQKQKLVLLFSDGEFQDNPTSLARNIASRKASTLLTFLCGSKKSPVPEYDLKANHADAFSTPDPARLQSLAATGGGSMYDLSRASAVSIENRLVDQARDIEIHGRPVPDYKPYPFVAAGLILLAAHQLLPAAFQLLKRRRWRTAAASIVLLMFTMGMAIKNPSAEFKDALKLASQGKHDEALKKLNSLKQEGGSEEIDVAIGNIYFAKKEIDQAITQYQSALQRNPGNKRARWNWEVSLKSKQNTTPPPPKQPPSQKRATQVPEQTKSLLNYFDQLETEQMKENNIKKKSVPEFAW